MLDVAVKEQWKESTDTWVISKKQNSPVKWRCHTDFTVLPSNRPKNSACLLELHICNSSRI